MVFYWSLSDRKSPSVSRTLLSILADLNDAVVSSRPLISKTSSPFTNPLVIVPRAPIKIRITVTFIFHSFSIPKQGPSTNPSFRFLSILLCSQLGQQSQQFDKFCFVVVADYYNVWSSGRDYSLWSAVTDRTMASDISWSNQTFYGRQSSQKV